MDNRKGVISGYKRLGKVTKFLFWLAIVGILIAVFSFLTGATKTGQNEILDQLKTKKIPPYLSIELATQNLLYDDKRAVFILPYRLRNVGAVAYQIRKGHMIFEMSDKDDKGTKYYYEPDNIKDTLLPQQTSAIHVDDIGWLDTAKSYKVQLVISYSGSEVLLSKEYIVWANLEFHPDALKNGFRIIQKSLGTSIVDTRVIREKIGSYDRFD